MAQTFLMKIIVSCVLLDLSFLFVTVEGNESAVSSDKLFNDFYEFAVKNKRQYISNSTELIKRFDIYKESVLRAEELNMPYGNNKPVFGINKFADMTPDEFKNQYLSSLQSFNGPQTLKSTKPTLTKTKSQKLTALPEQVDWRNDNVISAVMDQGECGACWAFSVTETMESMSAIQYNTSVPNLSIQEMIDCDSENSGCEGGDICQATQWASITGLVTDDQYPLTLETDPCQSVSATAPTVTVTDYTCYGTSTSEDVILQNLADHGPVVVAVDATTWHNYIGGIIQYHCSNHINHAVQIVGYNLSGDVPYYIIRNSWGTAFGDNGYMYIKYGDNLCGISDEIVVLNASPLE